MKKLLIKLRSSVKRNLGSSMGICDCCRPVYEFTFEERNKLIDWLDENLPEKTHPGSANYGLIFSWEMGKLEPRMKWLDEQIKNYK